MRQKMIPAVKVHTHVASTVSEFAARRDAANKLRGKGRDAAPTRSEPTTLRLACGAQPCITIGEAFSGGFARRAA